MQTENEFLQSLIKAINTGKGKNTLKTKIAQRIKQIQDKPVLGLQDVSESLSQIPYKCPFNEFSCTEIDEATSNLLTSCDDCKHSK